MKEDFIQLAQCFLSVMEGDDYRIEDAYKIMRKYNMLDEEGYFKYDEDETESD